jgi:hypothetical protein
VDNLDEELLKDSLRQRSEPRMRDGRTLMKAYAEDRLVGENMRMNSEFPPVAGLLGGYTLLLRQDNLCSLHSELEQGVVAVWLHG